MEKYRLFEVKHKQFWKENSILMVRLRNFDPENAEINLWEELKSLKKYMKSRKTQKMILDFRKCSYFAFINRNLDSFKKIISEIAEVVERKLVLLITRDAFVEISLEGINIPLPHKKNLEIKYYQNIRVAKRWLNSKKRHVVT